MNLEGLSPDFYQIRQTEKRAYSPPDDIHIVNGDHGESDVHNINWTDTRRRFFTQKNNFNEVIDITRFYEKDGEGKVYRFTGKIEWEGEINVGRLIIELLLISLLTVGAIFLIRRK